MENICEPLKKNILQICNKRYKKRSKQISRKRNSSNVINARIHIIFTFKLLALYLKSRNN